MIPTLLLREPFRVLFPLGAVLGAVAVSTWVPFGFGMSSEYPGELHRLVLTRAFLMCFAMGFLLTVVPRRTSSAPAAPGTLALAVALPVVATVATFANAQRVEDGAYAAMHGLLIAFVAPRFGRGGRRPPPSFALVPLGAVAGLVAGLWLALGAAPGSTGWVVSRRVIEQGVFLCWIAGVGGLFLPLISGRAPPADLGSVDGGWWRVGAFFLAGLTILGSLAFEVLGSAHAAPIVRGFAVAAALGFGVGAWRPPARPGLQRTLVWLAMWFAPAGLLASGLWPEHRVDLLHLTFIGAFSLGALAVSIHVILGHGGREDLATGRPPLVAVLGGGLLFAAVTRAVAPFTHSFALHLGVAACFWILAALAWGVLAMRVLLPGHGAASGG